VASIDTILTNLANVRERLDLASRTASVAAELTREVQGQLTAMGAYGVAERFTPVLEKVEEATERLAAGLAATEEAIALTLVAQGAASGGLSDHSGGRQPAATGQGAPGQGQGDDPAGVDRAGQSRGAAALYAWATSGTRASTRCRHRRSST
jgi:hypothetical protein